MLVTFVIKNPIIHFL